MNKSRRRMIEAGTVLGGICIAIGGVLLWKEPAYWWVYGPLAALGVYLAVRVNSRCPACGHWALEGTAERREDERLKGNSLIYKDPKEQKYECSHCKFIEWRSVGDEGGGA